MRKLVFAYARFYSGSMLHSSARLGVVPPFDMNDRSKEIIHVFSAAGKLPHTLHMCTEQERKSIMRAFGGTVTSSNWCADKVG